MERFKKIKLSDRDKLLPYLLSDNTLCCEFSFGNNILWNPEERLEYLIINDILIYRMIFDDYIVYCTPDFKGQASWFCEYIQRDALQYHLPYKITCLNEKMVAELKDISSYEYHIHTDRDHSDYIYLTEELATLAGQRFHKKKNHLNKFLKKYEFSYEAITEGNKEECILMKNQWMMDKIKSSDTEEFRNTLYIDSKAINYSLDNMKELGFVGGLIRIEGRVVAFTIGEQLTGDAFITHFEKALDGYDGLYTAINWQFTVNELVDRYKYVNREDDLGIPGLRKAKESYNPVMIYDKYEAIFT